MSTAVHNIVHIHTRVVEHNISPPPALTNKLGLLYEMNAARVQIIVICILLKNVYSLASFK